MNIDALRIRLLRDRRFFTDRGNTYYIQPDGTWLNPSTRTRLTDDYRFIKARKKVRSKPVPASERADAGSAVCTRGGAQGKFSATFPLPRHKSQPKKRVGNRKAKTKLSRMKH